MTVMIGIDPYKATHTAVAIANDEVVLDEFHAASINKPGQPALRLGRGL